LGTFHDTFTATSGSTNIQLAELYGASNGGVFLDNVSVAAVPEPATWTMMLLGFLGIGFMVRRGSRRQDISAVA